MGKEGLSTNNITQLFYNLNKTAYQEFVNDNSSQAEILRLGRKSGVDIKEDELLTYTKLTKVTLEELIRSGSLILKKINTKLNLYKKIELGSEIATFLGSGTLVFIQEQMIAILTSLTGLSAIFLNRGIGQSVYANRNFIQDADNLLSYNIEAESLLRKFSAKIPNFNSTDKNELKNLLNQADLLCNKINLIVKPHL